MALSKSEQRGLSALFPTNNSSNGGGGGSVSVQKLSKSEQRGFGALFPGTVKQVAPQKIVAPQKQVAPQQNLFQKAQSLAGGVGNQIGKVAGDIGKGVQQIQKSKDIKKDFITAFKNLDTERIKKAAISGTKAIPGMTQTAGGIILQGWAQQQKMMDSVYKTLPPGLRPAGFELTKPFTETATKKAEQVAPQMREQGMKNQNKAIAPYANAKQAKGLQGFAEAVAFNVPQMAANTGLMIGTAIATKNPALAASLGLSSSFGFGAGEIYSEARQNGVKDRQALALANVGGVIVGALDFLPGMRLLRRLDAGEEIKKTLMQKIVKGFVSSAKETGLEGITEGVQQVVGNALAKTYNEKKDLMEGVSESFFVGAFLGGFTDLTVSGIMGLGGKSTSPEKLVKKMNQKIDEAFSTPEGKRTTEQEEIVKAVLQKDMTPHEATSLVIANNLQETDFGKKVMQLVVQANAQGKDLQLITNEKDQSIDVSLAPEQQAATPPEGMPDVLKQEFNKGQGTEQQPQEQQQPEISEQFAKAQEVINRPKEFPSKEAEKEFSKLEENPVWYRDEYIKKFGNVVSTDLAHSLSSNYKGYNVKDTEAFSSGVRRLAYEHLLETKQGTGNNNVLFMAGAPGAGKTSAATKTLLTEKEMQEYPVIWDTTLANKKIDKEIKRILEKGYSVRIVYVVRDPLVAYKEGVLPRTKKEGRIVEEEYYQDSFEKVRENILSLYDKFKDNDKVDIAFIDNTGKRGDAHEVGVDFVKNFSYNKDALAKEIQDATDKAYEQKEITKEQYQAITIDRKELAKTDSDKPQELGREKEITEQSPNNSRATKKSSGEKESQKVKTESKKQEKTDSQPPTSEPAYKGGGEGRASGNFGDLPNLSRKEGYVQPLEFPEIVRMTRELTGKYPEVWKKLRNRLADAQEGSLKIRMSADTFKNTLTASKILSHELGHIADYLPEGMRRKGNLLANISSVNGYVKTLLREFPHSEDNILTDKDREKLKAQAKEQAGKPTMQTVEELVNKEPVDPKDILAIWNDITAAYKDPELLTYIQGLPQEKKIELAKSAMRGKVPKWINFMRSVKRIVTKEVINSSPEDIRKMYSQLLKEEILKRRLHDLGTIKRELKTLSRKWRPFNTQLSDPAYTAYRNSASELYADAISVLFNDPVRLKQEAPNFWRAFFNYIDQKPAVAQTFFDTWEMLHKGKETVLSERRKIVQEAFVKGEDKWAALRDEQKQRKENFFFQFKYDFIDKNQRLLDLRKKAMKEGRRIREDYDPEYLLNGRNYLSGRIKYMLESKINPIYQRLQKNDLTMSQLDEVFLYQRIIAAPERAEKGNPYGLDKQTAGDTLNHLKESVGEEKYKVLDQAAIDIRNTMKSYLKEAYDLGMYSKELYEGMANNPAYATFAVLDYLDTYISAHVYQGVGTLKEVASPGTATVMKMVSTIRALEHQKAKVGVFKFLEEHAKEELKPAKKLFNGKVLDVVESDDPDLKLVKYLKDGKVDGYYVDPYIASSLNYETPDRINIALRVLKVLQGGFLRPLFITYNVGFQSFNFMRDVKRFVKNYPSKSIIKSSWKAFEHYGKALPPSLARGFNKNSKVIQEMEENKILGITYNDLLSGKTNEDTQLEYVMKKFDAIRGKGNKSPYIRAFLLPLEFIERVGNTIETLPKVAGYTALKGKMPPGELANFVRSYLGSPDFLKGGSQKWWTNEMLLFSNAITQGQRADYFIATNPKTRMGYWWKTALIDFLPKVLMASALAGYFGEELKKQFEDVSEYDKTNYIIVPFGQEGNKTTYLRIPHDDTGRFLSGLLWKAMTTAVGKQTSNIQDSIFQLLSYAGGQFPSLSPILQSASGTAQYLSGNNPYDFYRGREALPDKTFKAGGTERDIAFATWLLQGLGANIILGTSLAEKTAGEIGWLEKLVGQPLVSNIVGRWVKVSNYGQTEQNRLITNQEKQKAAQKSLRTDKMIKEALTEFRKTDKSEETRIAITKELVKKNIGEVNKENIEEARRLVKKFKMGILKGANDPNVNSLIDATTNDERVLIMTRVKAQMNEAQYVKFRSSLIDNKVLSVDTQKKMKASGL